MIFCIEANLTQNIINTAFKENRGRENKLRFQVASTIAEQCWSQSTLVERITKNMDNANENVANKVSQLFINIFLPTFMQNVRDCLAYNLNPVNNAMEKWKMP